MQWLRSVEMVMLLFLVLVMVLAVQWLRLVVMLIMAMKIVTVKMLVMIAPSFTKPHVFLSPGHLVHLYNHLNIALQGAQTIP